MHKLNCQLERSLLTLFGEKFAQQFMSESFGWLDHIVFAMAPLGIITAIVGAIRVGGPSWMRAIIGRARENRATAEVELMSSTSHEVCELWNGESVVRTLGRPLVKQIVVMRYDLHNPKTFGLHTVETAVKSRLESEGERCLERLIARSKFFFKFFFFFFFFLRLLMCSAHGMLCAHRLQRAFLASLVPEPGAFGGPKKTTTRAVEVGEAVGRRAWRQRDFNRTGLGNYWQDCQQPWKAF